MNGIVLGWLFYKSGLVPRWLAMFGLDGEPLIFVAAIGTLFGAYEPGEASFWAIPEILFEAGITIYTIWKGLRPSPILDDSRYAGVEQASGREALAVP